DSALFGKLTRERAPTRLDGRRERRPSPTYRLSAVVGHLDPLMLRTSCPATPAASAGTSTLTSSPRSPCIGISPSCRMARSPLTSKGGGPLGSAPRPRVLWRRMGVIRVLRLKRNDARHRGLRRGDDEFPVYPLDFPDAQRQCDPSKHAVTYGCHGPGYARANRDRAIAGG